MILEKILPWCGSLMLAHREAQLCHTAYDHCTVLPDCLVTGQCLGDPHPTHSPASQENV